MTGTPFYFRRYVCVQIFITNERRIKILILFWANRPLKVTITYFVEANSLKTCPKACPSVHKMHALSQRRNILKQAQRYHSKIQLNNYVNTAFLWSNIFELRAIIFFRT